MSRMSLRVRIVLALISLSVAHSQTAMSQSSVRLAEPESRPTIAPAKDAKPESGAILFGTSVHDVQIEISESTMREVEADHRPYGRAQLVINGEASPSSGLKLKGAAGSYRHFDEKPGFTIKLDKFRKKQSFDGIDKFHLNNAVQDETFLHEWIGSEMFHTMGYPYPRVGHAWVTINSGEKRLYVVRENYNPKLLSRFFANTKGNLYDGGFVQDIDSELEKDSGEGDDERGDLAKLRDALTAEEFSDRQRLVPDLVDMDRFLTFMALERLVCHWDGYSCNINNYRLYFDPETNKAVFLPHGMDQLFDSLGMDMMEYSHSMLAAFVMGSNTWRQKYRLEVKRVYDRFSAIDWDKRIEERGAILLNALQEPLHEEVDGLADRIEDLKERVKERFRILKEQLDVEEPQPVNIALNEPMRLSDWYETKDRDEIEIIIPEAGVTEKIRVKIPKDGEGYGGVERSDLVTRGTYRFTGRFRLTDARAFEDAEETVVWRLNRNEEWVSIAKTNGWQEFSIESRVVEDQRRIEMGIALRATRGLLVVDQGSLTLTKIAD
ncbi:CotH kinase family protein [Pirellulaceae bacterium SH449]